jgi:hypothetical protein
LQRDHSLHFDIGFFFAEVGFVSAATEILSAN